MPPEKQIFFAPFRLDRANETLSTDAETIPLTRKAFAVLLYLAEHPGRLVTKDDLLDAVWAETHVTEGVLKVAIAEIRKALHDDSQSPRYIETAHRRGYRFIAETGEVDVPTPIAAPGRAVERESAMARLEQSLAQVLSGGRQLVLVTGEAGIGKTTLLDEFLARAAGESGASIARGQCLEHFSEGEPYFPILEALAALCRQPARERTIEILWQHAPMWLAQMPWLVGESARDRLKRETLGAAKERMLREIAEAIEAFTAETPLILALEDLHWSDNSTVDLIGHLARRTSPARLLMVGTLRPAETIVSRHPLRELQREMQAHHLCAELPLELLSEDAVARYINARCPGGRLPPELARLVHERTDGNPLFMVNVVDALIAEKQLAWRNNGWELAAQLEVIQIGIPDSLQQLIEKQLERLGPEERRVLSAASVAGLEFSTRTLSGGTDVPIAEIESRLEEMCRRRQFIRPAESIQLADGSMLERYGFVHEMHRRVLYMGMPQARRVALHRRLGEFQESAYAAHLPEIAAELSVHFAEGHDYVHAIRYLRLVAANAVRRYANREAIEHLDRAMEFLAALPAAEKAALEVAILEERGVAWRTMDDNTAAAADFTRAVERAREAGRIDWEVRCLLRLSAVLFWTDQDRSLEVAGRAVAVSRTAPDPWLYTQAAGYHASRRIRLEGWSDTDFAACLAAAEAARAAGDHTLLGLHLMSCAFFQCFRSAEREAIRAADAGLEIALETNDSYLYISCQYFNAWALLHLGEWGVASRILRDAIQLSEENGHGTAVAVLLMIKARLEIHARDFSAARDLAQSALRRARDGFARLIALVGMGEALLGLGDYSGAQECFAEVAASQARGLRLDWIFHMPFYRARGELRLARADFAGAREDGHKVCELASLPGQRTYYALGRHLLACVAMAQGDYQQAESEIAKARALLEGAEAPLAEAPVYNASADIAQHLGRPEEAAYRARANAGFEYLITSISAKPPLKVSHAR